MYTDRTHTENVRYQLISICFESIGLPSAPLGAILTWVSCWACEAKMHQYQIVGRAAPTNKNPTPKIYRMRSQAVPEPLNVFKFLKKCLKNFHALALWSMFLVEYFIIQKQITWTCAKCAKPAKSAKCARNVLFAVP